jgi:hypothetical protein
LLSRLSDTDISITQQDATILSTPVSRCCPNPYTNTAVIIVDLSAVGLDCEWRPSAYGGSGTGDPNSAMGASADHPVATLQLAFRDEVFVIDLLGISGVVTSVASTRNIDRESSSAESTPQGIVVDGAVSSSSSSNSSSSSSSSGDRSSGDGDGSVGSDTYIEHRLLPLSRGVLSAEEGALCAAIGELFAHTKIAILGTHCALFPEFNLPCILLFTSQC